MEDQAIKFMKDVVQLKKQKPEGIRLDDTALMMAVIEAYKIKKGKAKPKKKVPEDK